MIDPALEKEIRRLLAEEISTEACEKFLVNLKKTMKTYDMEVKKKEVDRKDLRKWIAEGVDYDTIVGRMTFREDLDPAVVMKGWATEVFFKELQMGWPSSMDRWKRMIEILDTMHPTISCLVELSVDDNYAIVNIRELMRGELKSEQLGIV